MLHIQSTKSTLWLDIIWASLWATLTIDPKDPFVIFTPTSYYSETALPFHLHIAVIHQTEGDRKVTTLIPFICHTSDRDSVQWLNVTSGKRVYNRTKAGGIQFDKCTRKSLESSSDITLWLALCVLIEMMGFAGNLCYLVFVYRWCRYYLISLYIFVLHIGTYKWNPIWGCITNI